jgi:tRNAThr (cytosine32-N3)-methyltransferase
MSITNMQALKPGGTLFIRDYGRHDLAQLRIKKERLLDPAYPGLYIRGDGTRVYFFPKKELEDLVTAPPRGMEGAMFKIEDSGEDRRMVRHYNDLGELG